MRKTILVGFAVILFFLSGMFVGIYAERGRWEAKTEGKTILVSQAIRFEKMPPMKMRDDGVTIHMMQGWEVAGVTNGHFILKKFEVEEVIQK